MVDSNILKSKIKNEVKFTIETTKIDITKELVWLSIRNKNIKEKIIDNTTKEIIYLFLFNTV